MYEKLDQAKMVSLEEIIPEPYKNTIEQVIKSCKLDKETFKEETNFTLKQLENMQAIVKEQQRRLLDPSIAIAEKRQIIIDKEDAHLYLLLEKL